MEAEKLSHDLTLRLGVMAGSCKNENEYLANAKKLIKSIGQLNNRQLSDLFFDTPPDKKKLILTLEKILANIAEVEKIPENKRHYDF